MALENKHSNYKVIRLSFIVRDSLLYLTLDVYCQNGAPFDILGLYEMPFGQKPFVLRPMFCKLICTIYCPACSI